MSEKLIITDSNMFYFGSYINKGPYPVNLVIRALLKRHKKQTGRNTIKYFNKIKNLDNLILEPKGYGFYVKLKVVEGNMVDIEKSYYCYGNGDIYTQPKPDSRYKYIPLEKPIIIKLSEFKDESGNIDQVKLNEAYDKINEACIKITKQYRDICNNITQT